MHTVFTLLCFVVVIYWLIFPYPSGLLNWHCGNLTIAAVPAKQPWWIWINTSCEFIMNDCITTTKQSTTKPCAYYLGYTVLLQCSGDEYRLVDCIHAAWGQNDCSHPEDVAVICEDVQLEGRYCFCFINTQCTCNAQSISQFHTVNIEKKQLRHR